MNRTKSSAVGSPASRLVIAVLRQEAHQVLDAARESIARAEKAAGVHLIQSDSRIPDRSSDE
jgi:hypothetical protein